MLLPFQDAFVGCIRTQGVALGEEGLKRIALGPSVPDEGSRNSSTPTSTPPYTPPSTPPPTFFRKIIVMIATSHISFSSYTIKMHYLCRKFRLGHKV